MANATILYACTDAGLAIFTKPGTLPDWLPPRVALRDRPVDSVWSEPGPPIKVLAVVRGELLLSESGGRLWDSVEGLTSVAAICEAGEPPSLFAGTRDGLIAGSMDGGVTWQALPPLPGDVEVLALSAGRGSDELIALAARGQEHLLFISEPAEGDWDELPAVDVRSFVAGRNSDAIYCATGEGVQVWQPSSTSWELLLGSPPDGTCIQAVPGVPGAPPALIVGTTNGLSVSPDGGAAWQVKSLREGESALPVTALARDPERRDRLYSAVGDGYLFESGNRGQAWEPVNATPVGAVRALFVVRF